MSADRLNLVGLEIGEERNCSRMFTYEMPLYEVKYHERDDWKEISDLELINELYKTHRRVTPAIRKMIMGKSIKTPHGIFRLKMAGGEVSTSDLAQSEAYN